ncbi:MAG: efflux RND transporter periplasmic adaptor subunit [Acidobacteriota bacterium]|nr:efflux RND transporter periplasmic adaptor subunit [Acidobacteriota bacterium]
MKKRSRAGVAVVALAAAAATAAFVRLHKVQAATTLPTANARRGEFLVLVRARGELTAHTSVQITAPVNVPDLQIVWLAPPGSEVVPGQVVIRFDPSAAKQQINEHTAALRSAQANLDQALAQARITAEKDKLDLATATYDLEKARLEASKQAVVSVIQGEESKIDSGLAQDKLNVQAATNNMHAKSDEAKIASLTRLRDQEVRELEITNQQLAAMEVKSPGRGIITLLGNYSQGWMNAQPYKVGDHAAPGTLLAEIPDLSTIEMESKVEEVDRGRISVGDSVLVHIDAFPEKTWNAKITTISPLTEQNWEWPPTRSFKSYAALDQPGNKLRPGMNASSDFVISRIPDAVSIPAKALFTNQGKPIVYVKTDHGYDAKDVRLKARNPDDVAVDGLAAGTPVTLVEPVQNGRKK